MSDEAIMIGVMIHSTQLADCLCDVSGSGPSTPAGRARA